MKHILPLAVDASALEVPFQAAVGYKFSNPGRARIRVSTNDEALTCDTSGSVWSWHSSGTKYRIDWNQISIPDELKEIAKAFFFYRLETRATSTVVRDAKLFNCIPKSQFTKCFPWDANAALSIFATIGKIDAVLAILFRVFYLWCVKTGKAGFSREIYFTLEESKVSRSSSYQNIFLHQQYVTPEQELLVLRHIDNMYDRDDWHGLQRNVMLHLAFELAPRPTQIYALNKDDLAEFCAQKIEGEAANISFFSLWLPMAKKQTFGLPERRPRRISEGLAKKIQELISLNTVMFDANTKSIFVAASGRRLPAIAIGLLIREEMNSLSSVGGHATLLRHHLGQGLADQGAPADVIAEALGHNSTVAARAYIAATPAIAKIKSRALGKNKTYQSLMRMMLTGEVAERKNVPQERWVKGAVHAQYIHGIGGCDLPAKTPCPKNPVYACYSCRDFHPFADGPHGEVRAALETQAQLFVDVATDSMDLDHTRVPLQLELTLEAVDAVIHRCAQDVHWDES